MDLLNTPAAAQDGIGELLRNVRVRSTIYCRSELFEPWGLAIAARDATAVFHLVLSGGAWLEVDDVASPRRLSAGDLVILTRGSAHRVRDALNSPVSALDEILADKPDPQRLRFGGGGARTELLCGGFEVQDVHVLPLVAAVPPLVHISGNDGQPVAWLGSVLSLLRPEFGSDTPGTDVLVARLADVLLTEALRDGLQAAAGANGHVGSNAALAVARDGSVVEALSLLHAQPAAPWSIGELARRVALSPSAFVTRFRRIVGESPMRYLTRYRLVRAAEELRSTSSTLDQIAEAVGYSSSVALSKAFRRHFGVSPGAYRRRER